MMPENATSDANGRPYIQFLNVYKAFDELPVLVDGKPVGVLMLKDLVAAGIV